MKRRRLASFMAIVIGAVVAIAVATHRGHGEENLVARIVQAVQSNDLQPVRDDFEAAARESITRERVGRLSDMLAPMGKIKSVDEIPARSGEPKMYVIHFEHGDWQATLPLDAHGKATGFAMRRMQS